MDLITLALAKKYTDSQRLGYIREYTVEMLPLGEYTMTPLKDELFLLELGFPGFTDASSMTVTVNNTMYNCEPRINEMLAAQGMGAYFGNLSLALGTDTGETEPFLIVGMDGEWAMYVTGKYKQTLGIVATALEIKKIDARLLPEVVPDNPLVFNNAAQEVTGEQIEQMAIRVIAGKTPCVFYEVPGSTEYYSTPVKWTFSLFKWMTEGTLSLKVSFFSCQLDDGTMESRTITGTVADGGTIS